MAKVYSRDDRGIVGVQSFGLQCFAFFVIHTALDVRPVVTVLAFLALKATLIGLAAVMMSFFFGLRGSFDVIAAIAACREPGWWVLLIVGLTELAIGLWAAGGWKASFVALVAWIAAGTMIHGVGQIASAFLVREIGHDVAARRS